MREPTITQAEVNAAADALRAGGIKPTLRAVRDKMGGRGSNATVLRLMQVWRNAQVEQPEAPIVFPAALQRALVDFIGQEVSRGKANIEAELVEAQQQVADLIAESERLTRDLDAANDYAEKTLRERDEIRGRREQTEADLAECRNLLDEARTIAESERTERAKAELRLEAMPRLEDEIKSLRTTLDAERAAKVAAEQSAAVSKTRQEGEGRALARAEKELETARTELAKAQAYAHDLTDTLHKQRDATYDASSKLARSDEQLRVALAELEKLRAKPAAQKTPAKKAIKQPAPRPRE